MKRPKWQADPKAPKSAFMSGWNEHPFIYRIIKTFPIDSGCLSFIYIKITGGINQWRRFVMIKEIAEYFAWERNV